MQEAERSVFVHSGERRLRVVEDLFVYVNTKWGQVKKNEPDSSR